MKSDSSSGRSFLRFFALIFCALGLHSPVRSAEKPNIVIIYSDDVGYGDVGCNGATKVKTPNIDRLASEGLRFVDAHSPSATCTPSRYALMTGEYAFRQKGTGVLPGDAALIVKPGRYTLPGMFKKAGYNTAVVGKWHLGLGEQEIDWNKEVRPGPNDVGFDYSFIMAATGDRTPCVYLENCVVVGLDATDPLKVSYKEPLRQLPIGREHPELLRVQPSQGHNDTIINGISRIGYQAGGKKATWIDEEMAEVFTKKAVEWLEHAPKDKPFFLYFATHDIHVPRVPGSRFAGTSGCGVRGDVIQELDWSVGEVVAALKRLNLIDNTLLIFSSDNGAVIDDGYKDGAVENLNGHKPAGDYRGGKYSNFEGGTRVPMIARWPGHVKQGVSNALVCHVDFLASFAHLTGQALPEDSAPDSFNVLDALLGQAATGREHLVEHAGQTSLRQGLWKYIPPSAGRKFNLTGTELGNDPGGQLFNLNDDPGEQKNLAAQNPDRTKAMAEFLRKLKADGKSRP
jgi:arylsulfatase A-like enzyme